MRQISALASMLAVGLVAIGGSGSAAAQQYQPDEFLNLDLSHAALSPKPMGPANTFRPGPLDVAVDRAGNATSANTEFMVEPKTVVAAAVHAERPTTRSALDTAVRSRRVAHARVARPLPRAPRALVALHRRDPMEAQARDTSIQVWPCRSGGICNWKR